MRDRTRVPCIGRWILNHCTTREVPTMVILMFHRRNLKVRAISILSTCTNLVSELASRERMWADSSVHTPNPHALMSPLVVGLSSQITVLLQVSHVSGESRLTLTLRFSCRTTEWVVVLLPKVRKTGVGQVWGRE